MPSISHTLSSKSADATACLSCMDGSASRHSWILSLCSSPRQYTLIESLEDGNTTLFSSMLYSIFMLPNEQRALRYMPLMFGMGLSSHSSWHFASWAFTSSRVILVSLQCRAVGRRRGGGGLRLWILVPLLHLPHRGTRQRSDHCH